MTTCDIWLKWLRGIPPVSNHFLEMSLPYCQTKSQHNYFYPATFIFQMSSLKSKQKSNVSFVCTNLGSKADSEITGDEGRDLYRCKAEGFLLYVNQSLIDVFNQPYLIFILYKEYKKRKCSISYDMPDLGKTTKDRTNCTVLGDKKNNSNVQSHQNNV
uniref:Uncharacterized protein n=1 Tax=Poecilia latipinna TaxID=48699 RepID=A0A3B3VL92_9TELE